MKNRNYRLYMYVTNKDKNTNRVRTYRWYTKMFSFILRNPVMFKDQLLTVHDAHGELFDISWDQIRRLAALQLKEGELRKEIRKFRDGRNWNE